MDPRAARLTNVAECEALREMRPTAVRWNSLRMHDGVRYKSVPRRTVSSQLLKMNVCRPSMHI